MIQDGQVALQQVLSDTLTQARIRNPAYSLRSFARLLRISPAALSEILNGKRRVSKKLAVRLLDRVNPNPVELNKILRSFEATPQSAESTASTEKRAQKAPGTKPASYQQLSMDHFNVVADWYHFAILSLAETEDFVGEAAWISQRLGLRKRVTETALKRLERLGLLIRDPAGHLQATGAQFSSPDEIASRALRRSHAQHLDLALHSLEAHEIKVRDFTGITMAIDPEKLPEAKNRIRAFRDELCSYLESGSKKEVYRMNIQLMPLSRLETEDGEEK